MVEIKDTFGLWERSLIAWPDGREDRTTYVAWLQGPKLFADLRQPANPPSFQGVHCVNDIEQQHIAWLSLQEGFAGEFTHSGEAFEWLRMIDYQCPADAADAGYLEFQGDILVEVGRDIPYIEHWHQGATSFDPHFAVRMKDPDGRDGFLVRVGDLFMYARNRSEVLPPTGKLAEIVKTISLAEARALVDFEISIGHVRDGKWLIERSSLPFRIGKDLAPDFSLDAGTFAICDITADGKAFTRSWKIVDLDVGAHEQNRPGQDHDQGATFVLRSMTGSA